MSIATSFLNPFVMGALELLRVQAGVLPQIEKTVQPNSGEKYSGEVNGLIEVRSPSFQALLVVSFPTATYLALMGKMFGQKYDVLNPEIEDGVAEFANIIHGHGRRVLAEKGISVEMSRPIVGSGMVVPDGVFRERWRVNFVTEIGEFALELLERC